jgi:hypothetical protein
VAGHGFLQVCFGVDDLEESKRIFVDVDAAELSNLIGCVSNKTEEVSAEVGMNLGGIDVGKVVGAQGLRGFPLLTATWTDRLDCLSIVCPSPRYWNFRPDRIGILLGEIGTFLSSFWRDWLSIDSSDFPRRFPLGYIHLQVRVQLE